MCLGIWLWLGTQIDQSFWRPSFQPYTLTGGWWDAAAAAAILQKYGKGVSLVVLPLLIFISHSSRVESRGWKNYSVNYIRRRILRQTDDEILQEDRIMDEERAAGIIPPTEEELMMMQQEQESKSRTSKQNLGKTQTEGGKESIDTASTDDPESPGTPDLKGGEI